jgi:hypothetical protein
MQTKRSSLKSLTAIAWVVLILGLAMVVYWTMFLFQKIPIGDIPILSESITALLAFVTGCGLLYRKEWAVPCSLVLAGMWSYGVIGGIGIVIERGLNFHSPFGAIADSILFPLILLFSLFMAITIWKNRERFNVPPNHVNKEE